MKIYVASSMKNTSYLHVIAALQKDGFEIWNWRCPPDIGKGFSWRDVDPDYQDQPVSTQQLNHMLQQPRAQEGFVSDMKGMTWADVCVLLLPCGRSAHMEAGYICGRGKPVYVLRTEMDGPDLMHLMFSGIFGTYLELTDALHTKNN